MVLVFYFYYIKIKATNLGKKTIVDWRGRKVSTGIFKYPVQGSIFLGKENVANDLIADRKVHGGLDKACYLFSTDQYSYWQKLYPDLDWNWGMFGENLTVESLDENQVFIGDIFQIGTALVQVSQPREPCYKLGIRFGSQKILKQFIEYAYPGTYVRLLKEGEVKAGDDVILIERSPNDLSIRDFFKLVFSKEKDQQVLELALNNTSLPKRKRDRLRKFIKKGG